VSTLGEVRLTGGGFEASARRDINFHSSSRKLYGFWKPGGKVDRANAARIAACMKQLGIAGSVTTLINAGTESDRNRVLASLSLQ
jgi:hypothetical protein